MNRLALHGNALRTDLDPSLGDRICMDNSRAMTSSLLINQSEMRPATRSLMDADGAVAESRRLSGGPARQRDCARWVDRGFADGKPRDVMAGGCPVQPVTVPSTPVPRR